MGARSANYDAMERQGETAGCAAAGVVRLHGWVEKSGSTTSGQDAPRHVLHIWRSNVVLVPLQRHVQLKWSCAAQIQARLNGEGGRKRADGEPIGV